MKFRFKLEQLLKVREHRVKSEKQKLGSLIQEQSVLQSEYDSLYDNMHRALSSERPGLLELNWERLLQHHLLLEIQALNRLKEKIEAKSLSVGRQRKRVTEADREVKKIEKLKQKAILEFRSGLQREEQNFQNEIGTKIYYSKRNL